VIKLGKNSGDGHCRRRTGGRFLKRGLDIVRLTFVAVLVLAIALTAGCAEGNKTKVTETNGGEGASRDSRPVVLVPRADGTLIFEGTSSLIDASHLEDGLCHGKVYGRRSDQDAAYSR